MILVPEKRCLQIERYLPAVLLNAPKYVPMTQRVLG